MISAAKLVGPATVRVIAVAAFRCGTYGGPGVERVVLLKGEKSADQAMCSFRTAVVAAEVRSPLM